MKTSIIIPELVLFERCYTHLKLIVEVNLEVQSPEEN